tara:strand:- start:590 stop:1120 length:531 start_codon:yes stop_codon:yes gene_type:complete
MANQRLTDKTELAEQAGSGDLLMVVDVSDTTGSSAGTSKKTDFKYVIQTDKISLSNAEAQALDSTPKTLVGALSGYMITVYNVTFLVSTPSGSESANKYMYMGYDNSLTTSYWAAARSFMNGKSDDRAFSYAPVPPGGGTIDGTLLNKPFMIWSGGAFNGDWTAEIYVTYAYTKVL